MAILFAFFKKTEVIARSIIDQWIELIVQTVVIALIQSLVVTFFLAGTASGNGIVVLGVGLICLVFMVIVLCSRRESGLEHLQPAVQCLRAGDRRAVVSPGTATVMAERGQSEQLGWRRERPRQLIGRGRCGQCRFERPGGGDSAAERRDSRASGGA